MCKQILASFSIKLINETNKKKRLKHKNPGLHECKVKMFVNCIKTELLLPSNTWSFALSSFYKEDFTFIVSQLPIISHKFLKTVIEANWKKNSNHECGS